MDREEGRQCCTMGQATVTQRQCEVKQISSLYAYKGSVKLSTTGLAFTYYQQHQKVFLLRNGRLKYKVRSEFPRHLLRTGLFNAGPDPDPPKPATVPGKPALPPETSSFKKMGHPKFVLPGGPRELMHVYEVLAGQPALLHGLLGSQVLQNGERAQARPLARRG